jgi:hypothetical protein
MWNARALVPKSVFKCVSQMGESARDKAQWFPNALSLWELHLCGSYECLEPWLERQTNTKLGPHDTIRKVLKHKFLRCPRIIHLDLICMSYDQRKGQSQIGYLSPEHKSLESKGQITSNWGVLYIIGKIVLRAINYCPCIFF